MADDYPRYADQEGLLDEGSKRKFKNKNYDGKSSGWDRAMYGVWGALGLLGVVGFCLFSNEGKEIKTLNVTLPAGTSIDYVEHEKKNKTMVTPQQHHQEEVKMVRPPHQYQEGYYGHYPYPLARGYHASNILMPMPQHPMFLSQNVVNTIPKQALTQEQVDLIQKNSVASSSDEQAGHVKQTATTPLRTEEELQNVKPFEEVAKPQKPKPAPHPLKPAASSSTDDITDSPLPDKDFERKKQQKRSYSDVVADTKNITQKPSSDAQPAKQAHKKPAPPASSSKKTPVKASSSNQTGVIVDNKPSLKKVVKKQPLPKGYSPLSPDYPARGAYNFFKFEIPERFKNSQLAKKFPQSFKYKLLAKAVGYHNMQWVQEFWLNTPKTGFKPDYPETAFYFTPFYYWRSVIIDENGEYINKCHVFNRFHANGEGNQCKYGPEDCKFYHMCMMCGSTEHSAFERTSDDDNTYICPEHAKLVAERFEFFAQGVRDKNFIDEIKRLEAEGEENSESDAESQQSQEEFILKPDSTLINNQDIFPPLPGKSPSHGKKKKNNNSKQKKQPDTPTADSKESVSENASPATPNASPSEST